MTATNHDERNFIKVGALFSNNSTIDSISCSSDKSGHNSNLTIANENETIRLLPPEFIPGPKDVICGRGSVCFNHEGNRSFRSIVDSFIPEYVNTTNKLVKSLIISTIVDHIRTAGGEFVRQDRTNGSYYEVGDFFAREKTSQAFRDAISRQEKSPLSSMKKYKYASIWNHCHNGNDSHQKNCNNNLGLPLTKNMIDSLACSQHAIVVPPSFFMNNSRENDSILTLKITEPRSLTSVDTEEDSFDKMIDDVVRPLPRETLNVTACLDGVTWPQFHDTKFEDFINDDISMISSLFPCDNCDSEMTLNESSENYFLSSFNDTNNELLHFPNHTNTSPNQELICSFKKIDSSSEIDVFGNYINNSHKS